MSPRTGDMVDAVHVSIRPTIQTREGKTGTKQIVRWRVAGADKSRSHPRKAAADRFHRDLHKARDAREQFDRRTGLPESMLVPDEAVTVLELAQDLVERSWERWSPGNRDARVESLSLLVAHLVDDRRGRPEPRVARRAAKDLLLPPPAHRVRHAGNVYLMPGVGKRPTSELHAAAKWLQGASQPVAVLASVDRAERTLEAVSRTLEGNRRGPDGLQKNRSALSLLCLTAVKQGLLDRNPVRDAQRVIEDEDDEVDPTSLPSFADVLRLIDVLGSLSRSKTSWQYVGYLTLRLFTGMRPSEAGNLRLNGDLHLPADGEWGWVRLRKPRVQKATRWTDGENTTVEAAKLKARRRGTTRLVDLHPAVVAALREYIERRGVKRGELLFRNANGEPFDYSQLGKCWRSAKRQMWPEGDYQDLTLYNLRHVGISFQLEAGVPVVRVAESVGNSPATLQRVYAQVLGSDDKTTRRRVDEQLRRELDES